MPIHPVLLYFQADFHKQRYIKIFGHLTDPICSNFLKGHIDDTSLAHYRAFFPIFYMLQVFVNHHRIFN